MNFFEEDKFIKWVDELAEKDYVMIDNFLSRELYQKLHAFFKRKEEEREFEKAALGDVFSRQVVSEIRSDFTYWIDREKDSEINVFFELLEELIQNLNRYCYLSLSGYEFHFAHYPKASFYKKHLDQFQGRNNRLISLIIYMNNSWQPGDGGELKIYREDDDVLVEPIANRCIMFKSDVVEHEVLPTNVSRYSLTGWLLHLPQDLSYLLS